MKDKATMAPSILIDLKKHRICVHKSTLCAIGAPEYVLLLVNPNKKTLAISGSRANDPRAHHICLTASPSKRVVELYSKSLLSNLHEICTKWQDNQSYRLYGKIFPTEGMAQFSMGETFLIKKRRANYGE